MLVSRNYFLRKYPHIEEDEYLRADFRDTKLLSLAFSLISAISFFATFILFKYTNETFDLIYVFSSVILSILTIVLSLRFKLTVTYILYKVFEGAFLASLSTYLKIKFVDWFETYEGYMFITAAATIVISNLVVSLYYLFFGIGIRNFTISLVTSFAFIMLVGVGLLFYFSRIVNGFSFFNDLLVIIPISLYFTFLSIMYNEEGIRIINEGCKKYYTWSISFALTLVFPYSFIEFINILKHNSRK